MPDLQLLQEVADVLREVGVQPGELTADTTLRDGLGLDSLKILDVINVIEDRYNREVAVSVLDDVNSVGQLSELIASLRTA